MSKTKKQLLSSAPWRGDDQQQEDKFQDARLRATKQPGSASTMYVPRKKSVKTRPNDKDDDDDQSLSEIDPELRYSFQRNFQVSLSFLNLWVVLPVILLILGRIVSK